MLATTPLVTVGIPTYNRPEGLEATIRCMLNQSYKNLEIIISDNCSTRPEVKTILEKYSALDSRVSFYVQEKNLSIVPNFQFLLDKARGEYFMWAADDDDWDSNFVEVCVGGLETDPSVSICMADLKLKIDSGAIINCKLSRSFRQRSIISRCFHFLKSPVENTYYFCGMYRTSMVKNIPFLNRWGGDHLFIYEALTKGGFLYVPGKANCYYYRGGSSKGSESVRKAFNIKSRFYFFDAYVLKFTTYQFRFRHLNFLKKLGLFFGNWLGLIFNEDFILYYIFIKKPVKFLFGRSKRKTIEPVS